MEKSPDDKKIRVLLVDDHPMTLRGVRDFLSRAKNIEIVGEAHDGEEGVRSAMSLSPDIVLMDIQMPKLDGIQATRMLRKEVPEIKVIILTLHDERESYEKFLKSGARGYVLKDTSPRELIFAIESVFQGNAYFSPPLSSVILAEYDDSTTHPKTELSDHERQIIILIAKGCTNKEIGQKLSCSYRTIEKHRNNLMQKLNLHSAVDLTRYAIEHHFLDDADAPLPTKPGRH